MGWTSSSININLNEDINVSHVEDVDDCMPQGGESISRCPPGLEDTRCHPEDTRTEIHVYEDEEWFEEWSQSYLNTISQCQDDTVEDIHNTSVDTRRGSRIQEDDMNVSKDDLSRKEKSMMIMYDEFGDESSNDSWLYQSLCLVSPGRQECGS